MKTLTLKITDDIALKVLLDLQEKHLIKIISKSDYDYLVFPGEPMTTEEFKRWTESRENSPSISMKNSKAKWTKKKNQLSKLSK